MSRTVTLSRRALRENLLSLPAGVTYLQLWPEMTPLGEFPHSPMTPDRVCPSELTIKLAGGPINANDDNALWCTRPDEHDLHVAHLYPGVPVVAWTDDSNGRCRICGCTDDDCSGCIERTGAPCSWAAADLCTACTELEHTGDEHCPICYGPKTALAGEALPEIICHQADATALNLRKDGQK